MRLLFFFLSLSALFNSGYAQMTESFMLDYSWRNEKLVVNDSDSLSFNFQFTISEFSDDLKISIINPVYVECNKDEITFLKNKSIDSTSTISFNKGIFAKQVVVRGDFNPIIKDSRGYKKMIFCELQLDFNPKAMPRHSNSSVAHSVLSSGKWYKIALSSNGIYRLSYQDLIQLGVDVANVNPSKLGLYGHVGGLLPFDNSEPRTEDLEEISIQVVGEDDGSFDANDYILFYGQSPHQWKLDESKNQFFRQQHYYDDLTYYFLSTDRGNGKRVNVQQSLNNPNAIINTFDDYQIHEKEEYNFIKSGYNWYGDVFDLVNSRSFNFSFPNRIGSANLKVVLAANAPSPYTSNFILSGSGFQQQNLSIDGVSGSYSFAKLKTYEQDINPSSDNIQVNLSFNSLSNLAKGWIDYIQINATRELKMSGSQMEFRSLASVKDNSISEFQLSNANSALRIWDVTQPLSPSAIDASLNSSKLTFSLATDELKQFIAFSGGYNTPTLIGQIDNQNLHALRNIDMLIVSHPLFVDQANRLASFHESEGLSVAVVEPQQIYNEFSSGSQDVSAIRDFAKMLYNQEEPLRYMLLFGDASYDPKDRIPNNTNFIVSYQSSNSVHALYSFVSDDFFALLDEGETINFSSSSLPFLDIGVGRFPVQTIQEAKNAVDKVIAYSSEDAFGDWRLNMCFVGDDNDEIETVHSLQAEGLADYISFSHPNINVDKIYLDAYQQETSTGGQRCPSANNAISEAVNKGMFVVNYTGHGGELGWAHERILEIDDINSWSNTNKLPLFMTATCEFSRYDDPERVSAGEEVFLNDDAGAIALLTTSRVVFTGSNLDLNNSFLRNLFPKQTDSIVPRLGDVLIRTKNNVADVSNTNHRNFTLLGDPALQLAYPKYDIVISDLQDSAKALGLVTLSGEIQSYGSRIEGFNGVVYPTVYDKRREFETLGQDESPIIVFDLQKNMLFKGKTTVKNGQFTFSFVVPRDINYDFGKSKISLYAKGIHQGQTYDASGYNLDMLVGGTADEYDTDYTGPEISLFMNDTNFIRGGITNANPSLYALVFDENGINTVSNGIGHDMLAILDEKSADPIVLNDFYEYNTDSYQSGVIDYPFNTLDEGKHSLRVKVWDVYNNSAESTTEFIVLNANNLTIQNLINYPNPVLDFTSFYFEHNQNNEPLEISLNIMDLQGRVVKQIQQNILPNGYRYGPISWNASSDDGSKLSSGIYVYSINVKANSGEIAYNSGRLILID